jgi:DNA-binding GntR family transcriptional regulator
MVMASAQGPLRVRGRGPAPSNVDVAVDALREAIVEGRLKPGERIKEIPLASQLGISRGPIRDALRLLERDGLVEVIPNRGAVVPEVHAVDVLEVYALRASLGSLALHKLMLEGTIPADALERALGRLRSAVGRGRARQAADADLEYQSVIIASSGLSRVTTEFERLTWQVRIFIVSLEMSYEDKLARILAEMEALHAAITEGRAPDAETLWRDKYERWVRNLVELLPEAFDEPLWTALTAGRRA